MARILITDDEANMRRILSVLLQGDGHVVSEAGGVAEAKALLASGQFDLVITDQRMKDGEGLEVIAAAKDADASLPVVMITAYASVELAVDAMRLGAFDLISKPFASDAVRAVVRRSLERTELVRQNELLKVEMRRLGSPDLLLGESPLMQALRERIARVAPTNTSVLITGETGTGKELVARAVHRESARASAPFVAVNCAAVPETLLESELFGHEKGAFTGADRARQGLFDAADRGTLFLDEAGEMSLSLQAKLLRVLNDGCYLRVGSTTPRHVDVRVVVATHRDLREHIREGSFREDLYYRIAVVPLEIPPLRDRIEDLPQLVGHFFQSIARDLKVPVRRISPAALAKLAGYAFPGNVRELRNLLERACILAASDEIGPSDFLLGPGSDEEPAESAAPAETRQACWIASLPPSIDLRATLESVEADLIVRALSAADGVQAEAARRLGVSRSDLAYKLKKYAIGAEPPG